MKTPFKVYQVKKLSKVTTVDDVLIYITAKYCEEVKDDNMSNTHNIVVYPTLETAPCILIKDKYNKNIVILAYSYCCYMLLL